MPDCHARDHADAEQDLYLSLSEIAALSWRAIRGAGRTWGEAEDGAEAAKWLARAGLDWAHALTGILSLPAASAGCPLRAGMALSDFADLPNGAAQSAQLLSDIYHPLFLLPFTAQVAARSRQVMQLDWNGASARLAPDAAPVLTGNIHAAGPLHVSIAPAFVSPTASASGAWPKYHFGAPGAGPYARLTTLMLHVTVPSSAASLAGAGAQGDDND
ncbi:DUF3726 domain-containing protein [Roseovarius sp. 217]|uniref:DUF3726 domain-containing protein n=1 Tax=Roseovarius sp. (strain 217) TaxID=314264 RepID=UPI0000684D7C|nr:DUF3726 domain-containing protein [Roseovarius sp. 217]EAQ25540.1 hypothetical protein ROS217_07270 [Roseovarius sp. 217]